ncbi:bifunctional diaminohydroxyphosphoribosylaminopyrimidine deaminase/5-amino-6-(5-phosphoribosylamino)uracil reductase RibD [Bacteroidales bacterium OttesenSCG-928-A17]|nr:bifunctional diaminohydroxyphosphoribosylaminopyrimidine deaminase/5-amino-6-(5-phosphoribosylamino)uracil reductase RibD [Bacteroidales bacterium OttesenSCG-928-A17]
MYRCLQLASYGKGFTAPNPLVGAVVVFEDRIIGEGFHRRCGEAHAEVNAIQSVKNENLLADSTLYVNLEPCSHYGKTPPCAELIIRKKIPRVVIGMKDPFPSVAGKGIQRLKEAGVEVKCGVLENECFRLNRRFLRCIQNQRPYIILKWAQSSDGFIDRFRDKGSTENPVRFSTDFTQLLVHKLRAEEAAITVGSRTEELDHPLLNVRFWAGKDPQKIRFDSKEPLEKQLQKLYTEGIQSLIVEGGAALLSSFIQTRLWDEARIEVSDIILKKGVKAPILGILPDKSLKCENSILFYNNTEIIS